MKESEINKILQQVSKQRLFGETDKALANLHKLNTAYPENTSYIALLASTYMEVGEDNLAEEYCHKALTIDPNSPETYEVLGLLAEKKKEYEQAEIFYLKSLEIDNLFKHGHLRIMLLCYEQGRYEEVVKEGEFLLQNFYTDRDTYSPTEKRKLALNWLSLIYFRLTSALLRLKVYEKAVKYINEMVQFSTAYVKDPYFFHLEDQCLYKLYYLLDNEEKIKEYEDRWLNHYKVPISRLEGLRKDVEQGYIESINLKNYKDEN